MEALPVAQGQSQQQGSTNFTGVDSFYSGPQVLEHFSRNTERHGTSCLRKVEIENGHKVTRQYEVSLDCSDLLELIKGCSKYKDLHKGSKIHAAICERGLLKDIFVSTALLGMFAKCGALAKAQELFEELPSRDVISWNTLITAYTHHGFYDAALECFSRMQIEGLSPDAVTFTCLLKACSSIRALHKGKEIHAVVREQSLLGRDVMLGNALVDMYFKCGELSEAQEVFDKLLTWNVVSWNVLVIGYAQHGLNNEVVKCFIQMQDHGILPDSVTFICVLKAWGNLGEADQGRQIHIRLSRLGGLGKNVVLSTALLDMYAKCALFAEAHRVFDELSARDVVCWNAIIAAQ